MRHIPPCADQLVVIVLANVPNVLSLQEVLMASCDRLSANVPNMHASDCTES